MFSRRRRGLCGGRDGDPKMLLRERDGKRDERKWVLNSLGAVESWKLSYYSGFRFEQDLLAKKIPHILNRV